MKVTLELVIRDETGNILSQNSSFSMAIGTQSLHDIQRFRHPSGTRWER